MQVLRTPDECFEGLPDYDFAPNWQDISGPDGQQMRVHYVDEGPKDAKHTIVLMHGEPSWSYLYRKMVPSLAKAGHRVIAPDLIGFGRSDKMGDIEDYTYGRHLDFMRQWLDAVAPGSGLIFFGQDWGGLIGLRLVAEDMDRFDAVVAANTFLPMGQGGGDAFYAWREYSKTVEDFNSGSILQSASQSVLSDDEVAAYNAPFPSPEYLAGARAFPQLVPVDADMPQVEENKTAMATLKGYQGVWRNAFSDKDPVTASGEQQFAALIPAAAVHPNAVAKGGGHFLQEDCSPHLVKVILEAIAEADKS